MRNAMLTGGCKPQAPPAMAHLRQLLAVLELQHRHLAELHCLFGLWPLVPGNVNVLKGLLPYTEHQPARFCPPWRLEVCQLHVRLVECFVEECLELQVAGTLVDLQVNSHRHHQVRRPILSVATRC